MKRILAALTLCLASVIAFAAPSPKQIEAALAARDYASAKTMITQVLAERPDSARAHLMKAYVLAAADKNKEAAKSELAIARTLDKDGTVVNSPLFGRTVGAIDNIAAVAALPPARPTPPPTAYVPPAPVAQAPVQQTVVQPKPVVVAKKDEGHGFAFWFFITLLCAGGVGGIVYLVSRKPKEVAVPSYAPSYSRPSEPEPEVERPVQATQASAYRPAPAPAPRRQYSPPPAPAYRAPPPAPAYNGGMYDSYGHHRSGSDMSTGAAIATGAVAGVAAAVVVDTMVENARLREREKFSSGSSNSWAPAPAPYVAPAPAPVEDRGSWVDEVDSFSSSSKKDDSWSSSPSPAPAPAEDSWSSSSSSSSDSWSSSDSGSSSSSDSW